MKNLEAPPFYRLDERRIIAIPGNEQAALDFSVNFILNVANESIADHGFFSIALSGGSTPKKIYQLISGSPYSKSTDWSRFLIFFSDERSAPPTDPESNYKMAMDSGIGKLPIPKENIFRMVGEESIQENAQKYGESIKNKLGSKPFDLIMLGMGEDGHTASLFPHTKGLKEDKLLVIANFVPQKETWRMSFTYQLINSARNTCIYVLGQSKAEMVEKVLTSPYDPENYPIQKVGTVEHPALWIMDEGASQKILKHLK